MDTAMVHRHNGMSPHADDCPAWFTGNPRLDGQPDVCTCGAAGSPPPEALRQPVDTYTPGLWVTLSEDEKYAEYIRVRTLLAAAGSPPSPPIRQSREIEAQLADIERRDPGFIAAVQAYYGVAAPPSLETETK